MVLRAKRWQAYDKRHEWLQAVESLLKTRPDQPGSAVAESEGLSKTFAPETGRVIANWGRTYDDSGSTNDDSGRYMWTDSAYSYCGSASPPWLA